MKINIETERLILREILPTDVEGIFELDSNSTVHKYLGNKPIKTKEKAIEIIQFIREQYIERGIGRFATIEKSSGDFVGWSGLKFNQDEKEELNDKRDFYDIGYRFIPRFWGKGYATESSLAILDYGFKELDIKTICGAADVENIASNKILQKIGLKYINDFPFEDIIASWYELKNDDYEKTMP
jgi:ribosomal-protein-alanine N-acetyltransferase